MNHKSEHNDVPVQKLRDKLSSVEGDAGSRDEQPQAAIANTASVASAGPDFSHFVVTRDEGRMEDPAKRLETAATSLVDDLTGSTSPEDAAIGTTRKSEIGTSLYSDEKRTYRLPATKLPSATVVFVYQSVLDGLGFDVGESGLLMS